MLTFISYFLQPTKTILIQNMEPDSPIPELPPAPPKNIFSQGDDGGFVEHENLQYKRKPKWDLGTLKIQIELGCRRVYQTLGPGLTEKAYQKAVEVELRFLGIECTLEMPVPFYYRDVPISTGYLDLFVDNQLVIELKKGAQSITHTHIEQCRAYMRALHIKHGMVCLFPSAAKEALDILLYDVGVGSDRPVKADKLPDYFDIKKGELGPGLSSGRYKSILINADQWLKQNENVVNLYDANDIIVFNEEQLEACKDNFKMKRQGPPALPNPKYQLIPTVTSVPTGQQQPTPLSLSSSSSYYPPTPPPSNSIPLPPQPPKMQRVTGDNIDHRRESEDNSGRKHVLVEVEEDVAKGTKKTKIYN